MGITSVVLLWLAGTRPLNVLVNVLIYGTTDSATKQKK